MTSMKMQKDRTLKDELLRLRGPTEISGEITIERMKIWSQSKNSTQLWIGLVKEARFNAVKNKFA